MKIWVEKLYVTAIIDNWKIRNSTAHGSLTRAFGFVVDWRATKISEHVSGLAPYVVRMNAIYAKLLPCSSRDGRNQQWSQAQVVKKKSRLMHCVRTYWQDCFVTDILINGLFQIRESKVFTGIKWLMMKVRLSSLIKTFIIHH